ncbi:ABC transporter ATP-binding protein/permease [Eubacteriales bacterium OttesenSCG-928-N14]|nr:ABC transporter ATP-binding protein/permease [Eubacteriales bacterium OttesenSCG-928-N14]
MPKRDYTKNKLVIFASFYKGHMGVFLLDLFCALLMSAIDVAFPMLSRYALNTLLPNDMFSVFYVLIGSLVAMYALRSVFSYIVTYVGHNLGVRIEADMRQEVFGHLQTLSFKFYDNNRTGKLMSHVTTDLFDITELAHHGPEDLFISFVTLIGALVILFPINSTLTFVLMLLIPVTLLFTISQRRRINRVSRGVKEQTAGINSDIESSISGVRVAKAFTNESYEEHKFELGNERFKTAKKDYYASMATFHSGMEFMTNLFSVAVIGVGGYFIMQGNMNVVDVLTFSLYVSTFLQPIRKLTQFVEQYTSGMAGFTRFVEIMNVQPDIVVAPDAKELTDTKGKIDFQDVSFSYDDNTAVLEHVNLAIQPNEKLAVVGPSGGGKTTLCQLIPRFYEVSAGQIMIDNQDIRSVTLKSLRQNIGIVSQDVFLFPGTVMENIRYGKLDATDEEVVEAARLAQIYDTVMEMPYGFDTEVGERGVLLSGGQKQRISIARIFLKNPPILILDEATSALDTVTELKIQESFEQLSKGRTTLIIAHRLSTIKNADMIVYIDDSGIQEQGTHDELLALDGLYAELHQKQFA